MIKVGIVTAIDESTAKARIQILDNDEIISDWLPILQNKTKDDKFYFMPDINEEVLAVFLDSGLEQGFIIGSIYNQKDNTPISDKDKYFIKFKDNTTIEYDRKNKKLSLDCKGDISIKALNNIDIEANNFNIKSNNINLKALLNIDIKATNLKAYTSLATKIKSMLSNQIEGLDVNIQYGNISMIQKPPLPEP